MDETKKASLIALLEEQRSLYDRLRVLAERQQVLVMQEALGPLMELLSQRQKLVDAILATNDQLAPYRQDWTAIYAGLDEPGRRRVASLLEDTNTAMNAILHRDTTDSATLSARRTDLTNRLTTIDAGARAGAAYAAAGRTNRPGRTDTEA